MVNYIINNISNKILTVLIFLALLILALLSAISCTTHHKDAALTIEVEPIAEKPSLDFQQVSLNENEKITREASVRVYNEESRGHGSGTYFLFEGYHVVFTAAHVVTGSRTFLIIDKYGNKRFGSLAYIENNVDFAIILIPAFKRVKPIKLKLPEYNPVKEIGKELIFSGYPGRQSLRTTRALIAGVEGRRFVMQSTAWKGSSGSCVFDSRGNFVGVVFALGMSHFKGNPVLLESMVWVEPYTSIDWATAKRFMKALQ
jgi:hypothetical protein